VVAALAAAAGTGAAVSRQRPLGLVAAGTGAVAVGLMIAGRLAEARWRQVHISDIASMSDQIRHVIDSFTAVASGDLTSEITMDTEAVSDEDLTTQISLLAIVFVRLVRQMRDIVEQVQGGVQNLAMASHEMTAQTEIEAATSSQQAAAITQVTSTLEELASTAAQIAMTSIAVASYAESTTEAATEGQDAVGQSGAEGRSDQHSHPSPR
jgi:methyl-accepting chemotaxis protein